MRTRLELQSGKIEKSISGRDFGIGIRIFSGLQSMYTYTTDFSEEGLLKRQNEQHLRLKVERMALFIHSEKKDSILFTNIEQMPRTVEHARKVEFMRKANEIARNYDERIRQVGLRYIDEEQHVLIANSEGKFVEDYTCP